MEIWTLDELEQIAANPKRKHVLMLIEEIRRLTAIAVTAEQLHEGTYVGNTQEILRGELARKLNGPRARVPD